MFQTITSILAITGLAVLSSIQFESRLKMAKAELTTLQRQSPHVPTNHFSELSPQALSEEQANRTWKKYTQDFFKISYDLSRNLLLKTPRISLLLEEIGTLIQNMLPTWRDVPRTDDNETQCTLNSRFTTASDELSQIHLMANVLSRTGESLTDTGGEVYHYSKMSAKEHEQHKGPANELGANAAALKTRFKKI